MNTQLIPLLYAVRNRAVYAFGRRTKRATFWRSIAAILTVLSLTRLSAEAAQPVDAISYTGGCNWKDSNKSRGGAPSESECDKTVNELIYDDGYTSIDFRSPMGDGSGLAHILFIGVQWQKLDERRQSMVLDQVVFNYPKKKPRTNKDSGFCIITSKPGSSQAESVRCESLTGKDFHIFTLSGIVSQDGPH